MTLGIFVVQYMLEVTVMWLTLIVRTWIVAALVGLILDAIYYIRPFDWMSDVESWLTAAVGAVAFGLVVALLSIFIEKVHAYILE